jgi:hypothetical protein
LTYDQGKEMARHRELTARTGVKVYFCDPHSPWQRGSCENTRVERDEQGDPIPGQITRWLNLLWAPPGVNDVLNDTAATPSNCSQPPETRVDNGGGRTDKCSCPR